MLIAPLGERQRRASSSARRSAAVFIAIVALETGCASSPTIAPHQAARPTPAGTAAEARPPEPRSSPVRARPSATPGAQLAAAERALAVEATLPELLRIALANNPEVAEARERRRAAREGDPAGSRLPDPEFEYQLWGQPLSKPYALDAAQMHMLGVRQAIPAPGSLGARADAALARANVAAEALRTREQDVALRVRRAFAEYYLADRESRLHLDHLRVAQQVADLARAAYQGTRGSQRDVLQASLEVARLHNDVAGIARDRRTARALLNNLMARAPDAPLGPPAALQPLGETPLAERETERELRRPEIAAAESAVQASASELDASRASARWPSFMVGLQYMYMPPDRERHDYGVTFSMSLPWLSSAHAAAVRAAEADLAAEKSALSSTRHAARYERYVAAESLGAARESLASIDRELLPLAQQSFESAEAAYRGGQTDLSSTLDALRSLLDIRIERERALVRVEEALADLERATGDAAPAQTQELE